MGLIVDVVIVVIFGLCIFSGYKNGLAKSLLKLATSVLAIIVALVLYKPFVSFVINNTLIDDNIQFSIEKIITQSDDENDENVVNEDSSMPEPIVKYLNSNLKKSVSAQKDKAITEVSKNAADLIVKIACIIIIYIIAKILLKIITVIFDIFTKLPVIKQFNELGGIIYGILEAFVIVLLVITLISIITPLVGNYALVNMIEQSYIGKILYNTNIFFNLVF